MLALLCMVSSANACTAQANSIHDDTTTDTGGSENASGGQDAIGGAATGGNANVGGTGFLDEGEILLGSCLFSPYPAATQCQDYVTRPEYGEPEESGGEQVCLGQHTGDTSIFVEWRGGEHCPLEGADLVCKGNVRISYFYDDDDVWTAEQAEEGCQTGDGYGVPVYWRE